MTGPEHYREAEALVDPAKWEEDPASRVHMFPPPPDVIALAQVHATLALAAATALKGLGDAKAWIDVAGVDLEATS